MVKSCRKDCPTASVLLEAKAAALHPGEAQAIGLASQSDRQESDGQTGDRQTGRNKVDEH
jgi:hypothetical protein